MKRIRLVLTVALVMAAMVVATAAPAFAAIGGYEHNPNFGDVPAAEVWPNDGAGDAGNIYTYQPSVANGGDPPKSGSPGNGGTYNKAFCLKHSDSC